MTRGTRKVARIVPDLFVGYQASSELNDETAHAARNLEKIQQTTKHPTPSFDRTYLGFLHGTL
jgi:predicted transcriptional regulator